MKFNEHTKITLDDTCTVFWEGQDKAVADMTVKEIAGEKFYKLDDSDAVKKYEGENYKSGDTFYLKDGDKNLIVKEDYDHWRAMAKVFVYNGDEKQHELTHRCNNLHVRCW